MQPYYIPQVLDEKVSFDARWYDIWVKGDVNIYDSKAQALVGVITITGTHRITVENYYYWHYMPLDRENTDMSNECYAWNFINSIRYIL